MFALGVFTLCLTPLAHASLGQRMIPRLSVQATEQRAMRALARPDANLELLYPRRNLSVPIDHFHNETKYEPHSNDSFALHYWFDATYYQPGGPVIVLQGGETEGRDRLPFLQKGIVAQLANATAGLGVILEHRYYGESFPVDNLTTESLRFLTTAQSVADMAYFAQHVVFPGFEDQDLTSATTPYIAYGGSYAGAFVAILRKLYPDVYWGAISSSGVTEAIYDYWQYYEAARLYAPASCVEATQKLTHVVDNILIKQADDTALGQRLKDVFGLGNITFAADFAYAISNGISALQGLNWDPALNETDYGVYCDAVSNSESLVHNATAHLADEVQSLVKAGGYGDDVDVLATQFLNYIGFINKTQVKACADSGTSQDECFTELNTTYFQQDDRNQTWRSWGYQVCTEWGYLQTGSGVPKDRLPLVSRLIDLNYTTAVCRDAFGIQEPPDVTLVNQHGGVNFSYPRLAIIDGEADPWRAATPHAIGLPDRESTTEEPFILIAGGAVHHWDENGLFPNETTAELPPAPVKDAQLRERGFVKAWLDAWWEERCRETTRDDL